jgi:RNA binding exosome subunit
MSGVVSIRVRAICGPTESAEKVRQAIRRVLQLPEGVAFEDQRLTGVFGEPLTVLETEIVGVDAETVFDRLQESLPSRYLEEGSETSRRTRTIHVRLNKQLAAMGVIQPSLEDAIKIEIRLRGGGQT